MDAVLWISSQRAHSYTEAWKEAEAEADTFHLRRAKAFSRVLEDSPAIIRDGELIVGSATKYVRGAEVMVEFNPYDILSSLKEGRIKGLSEVVTAKIENEDEKFLEEDANYWVGRSTRDAVNSAWQRELGKEYLDLADNGVRVYDHNVDVSPKGSSSFNPRVLREGLKGIMARAIIEKNKLVRPSDTEIQKAKETIESSGIKCDIIL